MRIAVLTHNYPRFPGDFSGNFVAALSDELARQGNSVTVLAPWDAAYQLPSAPSATLQAPRSALHLWRYAPRASWHRLGYMRTMEADVRMRRETYLLAPAFFAAGTAATLRWCQQHRPHVIHAHWLLPNGFFGAVASRQLGIPLVVSIPGSDALVAGHNPLFRAMTRFTLDQASLITANSHALRDVAIQQLGANPARFDLVIYGVNPNTLRPDPTGAAEFRGSLGISDNALLLLAVGRMVYKKGFDIALRALAVIKQSGLLPPPSLHSPRSTLHFTLVGDGDLWKTWQALARDLGLDGHVHWLGRVPFDRMGPVYNAADALVMPSVTRPADGLNVCVLDAMACARPVIGTTAAGNELVIRDGSNGYIVAESDPHALANAMLRLAALPPTQRQAMGAEGRRLVETEFGWPHLARRYLDHFQGLVR
jgi:glycosyltransferase involved in cell wall biosynthesis